MSRVGEVEPPVYSGTVLSNRMRGLGMVRGDLPDNWFDLADDFERAAAGFYCATPSVTVREFVATWARARKAWCEATGEPLV